MTKLSGIVKELTSNADRLRWPKRGDAQLLRFEDGWLEVVPQVLDGAHGLERARHHLGGSRATWGVWHLGLEQFSVGEDDAQLVVQTVEQKAEFW